jgi:hypothetical protein
MITEDQLRILQARFEPERQAHQAHCRELEKLRRQFVAKFPPSRIPLLSLDDYVEGKGSRDSFCYWVEWKTSELGRIQGSNASKFGVFFDKESKQYQTTAKFANENEAIAFLREQIVQLLEAGKTNDLEAIRAAEISPMFKGKILFLYYPDKFLNVFSEDHVDHFLREAGFVVPDDDVLAKRALLLDFKNDDEVMSKWTTYDIKSFELDGTPKHIEVKATTSKPPAESGSVRFYLSAREYEQAKNLPNYYLFIVFEVKSAKPKIWRVKEPAKLKSDLLHLQPSAYHATFAACCPHVSP